MDEANQRGNALTKIIQGAVSTFLPRSNTEAHRSAFVCLRQRGGTSMCGIFGYVGNEQDAAEIVLRGLKKLEYRGYDSWGVAVADAGHVVLEKRVGKIGDAAPVLPASTVGLGHTRWATHGGVTQPNAHPHLDCAGRLAVIHNGIITNYRELRDPLARAGHRF